jgi:hypothetical protein
MKKLLFFTALSLFIVSIAFAEKTFPAEGKGSLTFSVADVIANAVLENAKDEYPKDNLPYNLEKLQSVAGKECIDRTIKALNEGNIPQGISEVYGQYRFHNENCYTKAVIGHFCGSTLQFANKLPNF